MNTKPTPLPSEAQAPAVHAVLRVLPKRRGFTTSTLVLKAKHNWGKYPTQTINNSLRILERCGLAEVCGKDGNFLKWRLTEAGAAHRGMAEPVAPPAPAPAPITAPAPTPTPEPAAGDSAAVKRPGRLDDLLFGAKPAGSTMPTPAHRKRQVLQRAAIEARAIGRLQSLTEAQRVEAMMKCLGNALAEVMGAEPE